uniref:Recep_L_domain domain-containing protein n=1 Tax=Syphacia muris TaxID=451379 RepID=A0A0N5AZM6_9BILA
MFTCLLLDISFFFLIKIVQLFAKCQRSVWILEVALVDWASGIYVSVCGDTSMDNVTTLFKTAFVEVLNRFCQNVTACQLQRSVIFNAGDVMILEGYPRREYNGVRVRFVVVLPGSGLSISEQKYPLLSKEVIFSNQNHYELENRMQMYIMEYERYPRFDSITEFMNTAVIPIGFLLIVVMFGLAYWTSTLTNCFINYCNKLILELNEMNINVYLKRKDVETH